MGTEQQNAVGSKAHGKKTAALKRTHPKKSIKPAMVIGLTLDDDDDDDDKKPHLSADEYRSMAGLKPRKSATTDAKDWAKEVLELVALGDSSYNNAKESYSKAAAIMQQQTDAGMTQTQVAEALGKSQQWVSAVLVWAKGDKMDFTSVLVKRTPFSDQGKKKRTKRCAAPDPDPSPHDDDDDEEEDDDGAGDAGAGDADEAEEKIILKYAEATISYLTQIEKRLDRIGVDQISKSVKNEVEEELLKLETFSHALRMRINGSTVVQQALDLLSGKPTPQ